jgi:hypothetical protein
MQFNSNCLMYENSGKIEEHQTIMNIVTKYCYFCDSSIMKMHQNTIRFEKNSGRHSRSLIEKERGMDLATGLGARKQGKGKGKGKGNMEDVTGWRKV